ncbi:MAG: hypothetical protein ACREP4_12815 [Stenotrophomonas sp.]|uniref:O-linked N-acetylglucosamine transferase family protein n=1 Tax=Stenotrophomonas sp. TaxID=69392 RepID=UPI003D6D8D17
MRIGYLSADFRNHPVAHLITQVIAAHDRKQFEAHLYAYGPEIDDEERRRLIEAADHFTGISRMDDVEAAQRIRDDQIDILIDLTGYTAHARLGICALRPTPVIASWIGYIGTLGGGAAGRLHHAKRQTPNAKRQSLADHRARIALTDIALDTFPYNSGATASDVLRAGVPLVTCMGETFVSRMAGSLLHTLGMDELCTSSRPDYVSLVIELARNASKREAIRRKLGEQLSTSVLYQPDKFASQLEQLLRAMHEQAKGGRRSI